MYTYKYLKIYIKMYTFIYTYMYVSIYTYAFLHMYIYICVALHMITALLVFCSSHFSSKLPKVSTIYMNPSYSKPVYQWPQWKGTSIHWNFTTHKPCTPGLFSQLAHRRQWLNELFGEMSAFNLNLRWGKVLHNKLVSKKKSSTEGPGIGCTGR